MSAREMSCRALGPVPVAISVAIGIGLSAGIGPLVSPLRLVLVLAALYVGSRDHRLALAAGAVFAGLAIGSAPPPGAPRGVTIDDLASDRVVGNVVGPIVVTSHGSGALLVAAPPSDDPGEVWIWAETALVPGQTIAVSGRARSPTAARSPGTPSRHGPEVELVAETTHVLADDPDLGAHVWRWARAVQTAWAERIDAAGGDPIARAALRGIVLGDRSKIPPALDDRFRATGIFHVLSVSGLHLAVVAGLLFSLLRRLFAASPWGGRIQPARWAAPPALVFALAYTLITGAQLATLRALLVIAIMLVGEWLERPVRLLDALGAAAIVLLAWRPNDLFDPSFQLSFTAALTLALIARSETRGIRGYIVRGIVTSTWVILATAPVTAYHFQQIAPSGIVGNLVLTPALELLALPLALAGIVLGPIGWPLIRAATGLVGLVDGAAGVGADLAIVGRVAVASPIVVAILVALSLVLVRTRRGSARVAGFLVLAAMWAAARSPVPPGVLRVTFLDVGQGDAAIIELPDGGAWLVDAGGHAAARDLPHASSTGVTVDRALAAAGISGIDLAIISHPHPDHYLGLAALRAPIGEVWTAAEPEPSDARHAPTTGAIPAFATLLSTLASRGTRIAHPPLGLARERAGVQLFVWAPRYEAHAGAPTIEAADPVRDVNDNSLVVELRYRGRSVLFVGDVEGEGEAIAIGAGVRHVDVVKVAHHGSPTSSSPPFVAATSPSIAVISCGRGNTFGFPSREVIARWQAVGTTVARTDTDGTVTALIDGTGALSLRRFAHDSR